MVLEAVLLHGPDRALEEAIDMKTDIKALQSFTHADFGEAGKVQQRAADIIALLEDGNKLRERRSAQANSVGPTSHQCSSSGSADMSEVRAADPASFRNAWAADDDGFAAAFDELAMAPPKLATQKFDLFGEPVPDYGSGNVTLDASVGAADSTSTPSHFSGAIGKLNISGRDERDKPKRGASGGLLLGTLPAVGAGAILTPPTDVAQADTQLTGLLGTLSAGIGLLDAAAPPMSEPLAFSGATPDFEAFEAATAAPPQSAADALLENSLSGFTMGDAGPAKAEEKKAAPPMGVGSGLAFSRMGLPPRPPMPIESGAVSVAPNQSGAPMMPHMGWQQQQP